MSFLIQKLDIEYAMTQEYAKYTHDNMQDNPLIRNTHFGLNMKTILLYQATSICGLPVRASWVILTDTLHHLFGLISYMFNVLMFYMLLSIIIYNT